MSPEKVLEVTTPQVDTDEPELEVDDDYRTIEELVLEFNDPPVEDPNRAQYLARRYAENVCAKSPSYEWEEALTKTTHCDWDVLIELIEEDALNLQNEAARLNGQGEYAEKMARGLNNLANALSD